VETCVATIPFYFGLSLPGLTCVEQNGSLQITHCTLVQKQRDSRVQNVTSLRQLEAGASPNDIPQNDAARRRPRRKKLENGMECVGERTASRFCSLEKSVGKSFFRLLVEAAPLPSLNRRLHTHTGEQICTIGAGESHVVPVSLRSIHVPSLSMPPRSPSLASKVLTSSDASIEPPLSLMVLTATSRKSASAACISTCKCKWKEGVN
jgi:hypothetical protein